METLATTASAFFVRVVKYELTSQLCALEFHLGAYQSHHSLAVDYHLYTGLLDDLVKFFDMFVTYIVHAVG